ncbi:hypothetical protein SAMD00019534_011790, partial [Acytostelium subglobosum LB1]|uniref:hypothetical protein n=1 Tax=Acytostelium subglobosum LB1 TaxID=1410327 RepID=UPI000644949A
MSFLRKSLEIFNFGGSNSTPSFSNTSSLETSMEIPRPLSPTSHSVSKSSSIEIPARTERESSWFRMVQVVEAGSL